jgi:hypothetical protein
VSSAICCTLSVFPCVAFPRYYAVAFQPVLCCTLYIAQSQHECTILLLWLWIIQMAVSGPLLQLTLDWNEYKKIDILADRRTWLRNVSNCFFYVVDGYNLCKGIALYHDTGKKKMYSNPITDLNRPWQFQEVEAPIFQDNWHMKLWGQPYAPAAFTLVLISIRDWVDPSVIVRLEGLCQWKIPTTPPGFEPATFRFCSTVPQPTASPCVPNMILSSLLNLNTS